jgi:hypothetical protein
VAKSYKFLKIFYTFCTRKDTSQNGPIRKKHRPVFYIDILISRVIDAAAETSSFAASSRTAFSILMDGRRGLWPQKAGRFYQKSARGDAYKAVLQLLIVDGITARPHHIKLLFKLVISDDGVFGKALTAVLSKTLLDSSSGDRRISPSRCPCS